MMLFNCFRGRKKSQNDGKKMKIDLKKAALVQDQQHKNIIDVGSSRSSSFNEHNNLMEFIEEKVDPLESRIARAAYAAGDVIENHIAHEVKRAALKSHDDEEFMCNSFYQDMRKLIEEMDLIKKVVMEIIRNKKVVKDHVWRNVAAFPESDSSGFNNINTMVGFDDVLLEIMDQLTSARLDRQVIPIIGMGGIGKTTLARNVYTQPLINEHFDICAWVAISQQYDTKEILCEVLSQVKRESKELLVEMREDEVGLALYKYLSHRRFLVVMDDMWSIEPWDKVKCYFPNNNNRSRIIVTTRLSKLGSQLDNNYALGMSFLDEASSWNLFLKIVFGEKSCPLELKIIGKKIAQNCKGLPLSIVVMGGLLKKVERTRECWESIRDNLNSVVNSVNDEYCLKILKMSYSHLPPYLKPCFLYMGAFKEDCAIQVSTLIKLWVSEGFLKPISGKTLETIAKEHLNDLADRNLILVHELGRVGDVKYCKIHDLLRDLCLREDKKEKFYRFIMRHVAQDLGHNDILKICSKKEIQSSKVKSLRTMKHCGNTNQSHKKFLGDVLELVNMRYLVLEADPMSEFPFSFSLLWNLETLIVSHCEDVNAPIEIWKMAQLRHVEFTLGGLYLPDPPNDDTDIVIMKNLQTLAGRIDLRFTKEVVKRIPNLMKLGIEIERMFRDHYYFSNLECLDKLESFHCYLQTEGRKLTFPHSLKKLRLKAPYYMHWEKMLKKIGSLPLLQKLILRDGCFKTREWETVEGQFSSLKFLSLEQCEDLEKWTTESSHFPRLEHLHLYGVRELKEIPSEIGDIPTLRSIQLVYCNASTVESAKRLVEEQEELQGEEVCFRVRAVVRRNEGETLLSLTGPNFEVEVGSF